MTSSATHPKFEPPQEPHAKHRYESALRHAEFAKNAGKSSEQIHEVFRKVMDFNPKDIDLIPLDEAHRNYRLALIHAKKAQEAGKTPEEVHKIFKDIKSGNSTGTHAPN